MPSGTDSRWARMRALHSLMLEQAHAGQLSYTRQLYEMAVLKLRHGIGVNYYHIAGFSRRAVPWESKQAHLGARDYVAHLERMNPPSYRKLSQHKLTEKALLTLLGVPTPRYLGYAHASAGRTPAGNPLTTAAEFERFVENLDADTFCLKLMEGHGGVGSKRFDACARAVKTSSHPFWVPILFRFPPSMRSISQACPPDG